MKKLVLKKEIVAKLNSEQMNHLQGGAVTESLWTCKKTDIPTCKYTCMPTQQAGTTCGQGCSGQITCCR